MSILHKKRLEELAKRKNVLPAIIITGILWGLIVCLVLFFDPYNLLVLPLFFVLVAIALFFTASLIILTRRRAFLLASVAVTLLLLRYFGIGSYIHTILLVALALTVDYYFSHKS